MARILVVDDQPQLAELIQVILAEEGHAVEVVNGGQAALDRLGEQTYDLVICDLQMPEVDGVAVYQAIERLAAPRPVVLLMTGHAEGSVYADFLRATRAAVLEKPVGIDEVRERVHQLLHR